MKNKLIGLFLGGFLLCITGSASAYGLFDWKIDFEGTSGANGVVIGEFIDIISPNFVDTAVNTSNNTFTFSNHGAVKAVSHDGGAALSSDYELTGVYSFTGSGNLNTGLVTFFDGTFNLYVDADLDYASDIGIYGANNGTPIASFNVITGQGGINASGLPNGTLSIIYEASMIKAGYFIMPDGFTDMSDSSVIMTAYTTTNASHIANLFGNLETELYELADYTGPAVSNTPPDDFFLSSNGQFRIDVEVVPIPTAIFLFGSGIIALLGLSRKRNK
jgi:hypothetical protein